MRLAFSKVWMSRVCTSAGTWSAHCAPPRKESAPLESLTMTLSESSVCTAVGRATTIMACEPPTRPKPLGAVRSKVVGVGPPPHPARANPAERTSARKLRRAMTVWNASVVIG